MKAHVREKDIPHIVRHVYVIDPDNTLFIIRKSH